MSELRALSWEIDGSGWPNRDRSTFVEVDGLRWHVQRAGSGPALLLLHGTGASTHSFRDLLPQLAMHFEVVAPDLPGHGFTARPDHASDMSMPGMARHLTSLLSVLRCVPCVVVGHSAGAALALRMALDGAIAPQAIVSLNGALLPLAGLKHPLFSSLVRGIVGADWVARRFAASMEEPGALERVLRSTGSQLDATGLALYRRLSSSPAQVGAVLTMMGRWDLRPLERDLPRLAVPLLLVTAALDRMILPGEAVKVRALVPSARIEQFSQAGHLVHEEKPQKIATLVAEFARHHGVV